MIFFLFAFFTHAYKNTFSIILVHDILGYYVMINNSDLHLIFKWNAIHFHLRTLYTIYSLLNDINK